LGLSERRNSGEMQPFMPLLDHANRLFLAVATIEKAFRPK
jgi:hypothetical protein